MCILCAKGGHLVHFEPVDVLTYHQHVKNNDSDNINIDVCMCMIIHCCTVNIAVRLTRTVCVYTVSPLQLTPTARYYV